MRPKTPPDHRRTATSSRNSRHLPRRSESAICRSATPQHNPQSDSGMTIARGYLDHGQAGLPERKGRTPHRPVVAPERGGVGVPARQIGRVRLVRVCVPSPSYALQSPQRRSPAPPCLTGVARRRGDGVRHEPRAVLAAGPIARVLVRRVPTRCGCRRRVGVETYVGRILAKLGMRDRVPVVVLAYAHGLVRVGHPRPRPG